MFKDIRLFAFLFFPFQECYLFSKSYSFDIVCIALFCIWSKNV